jgi:ADP-glucose pyrophosphorylase
VCACVQAYAFQGYWEDIGTIDAFFNANLALVGGDGKANFSFYDKDAPIYTMSRFLPPSKVMNSKSHGRRGTHGAGVQERCCWLGDAAVQCSTMQHTCQAGVLV